jgi:hypothetical protein
MDSVRIYFKVHDFSRWKRVFDEDVKSGLLEQAGVTKYDLQRLVDTGEPSLYFELKSSDQFKEFIESDTTQKRMKEAGIIGTPRFEYMERLEEKPVGSTKKIA